MKSDTFVLEKIPSDRKNTSLNWVFKLKTDADGKPQRFKARLFAHGFTQVKGLDYDKTYSRVVRVETIQILIAIAARMIVYRIEKRIYVIHLLLAGIPIMY